MKEILMNSEIFVQKYNGFDVNMGEVLRYSLCQGTEDARILAQANLAVEEVLSKGMIAYNVCYRVLPVTLKEDDELDFECISMKSRNLSDCIKGCQRAVFIVATIGQGVDRLIRKYNSTDSSKALFMQAVGAERVETMLDSFCEDFARIHKLNTGEIIEGITPRFSPGYGDLPLAVQPEFLRIMDASRKIGVTINDSLLMSPSKSVTAIAGIRE